MKTHYATLLLMLVLGVPGIGYTEEPIDVQIQTSRGEHLKALVTYDTIPKRKMTTDAAIAAGRSAWALSLPERAIEEFEKALLDSTLSPVERGRTLLTRGIIELQEGRYQVAALYADKATKVLEEAGPLRAKAWLLSGQSLARLGNYGAAAERLRNALDESSEEDEGEIRYQLGDALLKLNRLPEAEEHLQAVPVGHDRTASAVRRLAEIALSLNKPEQAAHWLNKGRTDYPDAFLDSWVDYALVQSAIGTKDFVRAEQIQSAANQKYTKSDFWLSMLNAASEIAHWDANNQVETITQ